MKSELRYVELKSGFSNNGPAWIGKASFSKSGRTVYFNGKALKNLNGQGISGNYFDLENGEEYWVSGVKKNGTDRHKHGGGKIMIDRNIVALYLRQVDCKELDKNRFELTDIKPTDKQQFTALENEKTK